MDYRVKENRLNGFFEWYKWSIFANSMDNLE